MYILNSDICTGILLDCEMNKKKHSRCSASYHLQHCMKERTDRRGKEQNKNNETTSVRNMEFTTQLLPQRDLLSEQSEKSRLAILGNEVSLQQNCGT